MSSAFDRVTDKRKDPPPPDPCRVCGAPVAHTKNYNSPTMKCIEFFRGQIVELNQIKKRYTYASQNGILTIPGQSFAPCSEKEWNKFIDEKVS